MTRKLAVAVDLGATRMRICAGTESGNIVRKELKKMRVTENVDDYLAQITGLMKGFAVGLHAGELQGVCVASPGPLDLKRGCIVHTANLPYPEVPIIPAIREALGVDAFLVNDANSACLGEWVRGAGRGSNNVFYVTISTGIGGGAVVDGRLLLGKEGNAAEVGHTTIDSSGLMTCGCGRRGHWEAYCSGRGMPAFARKLAEGRGGGAGSALLKAKGKLDAATIFTEAARHDRFASYVVREVGRLNAVGVANVIDAFDPELVTLGGGVALNNPEAILSPILAKVGDYAINRVPKVAITPLGDDAGLLGALAAAYDPSLIGE